MNFARLKWAGVWVYPPGSVTARATLAASSASAGQRLPVGTLCVVRNLMPQYDGTLHHMEVLSGPLQGWETSVTPKYFEPVSTLEALALEAE